MALLIAEEIQNSSFVSFIYSSCIKFLVLYRNLQASELPHKTAVDFLCT